MYNEVMNHNQLLGVAPDASSGDIQSAFRKAAMEVHPDHSSSPEAAEAFARIKQARDELMKRAREAEARRDDTSIHASTAAALRATAVTTYTPAITDDLFDGMTLEEVAHIQMLDNLVRTSSKRSLFRRARESTEVTRHRRKLNTNNNRIIGKY